MEQRPLRLGDILDDYCPRERRITNHTVAVLEADAVLQTRCTTCESEHPYKHAKMPLRKKKSESSELYDAVLAGVAQEHAPPPPVVETQPQETPAMAAAAVEVSQPAPVENGAWGHRPLIRATLPKIEGQLPPVRPLPEFTIRQQTGRYIPGGRDNGGGFSHGRGNGHAGNGSGHGHNGHGGGQGQGGNGSGGGGGRHRRRHHRQGPPGPPRPPR
jgi:hypothetical protein